MTGIKRQLEDITVEPFIILTLIAASLFIPILQDHIKLKICHLNFKHSFKECSNIFTLPIRSNDTNNISYPDIYVEAHNWSYYYDLVQLLPCFIVVLLLGAWSDHRGRKPLMIFYCIGSVLATIFLIFNVAFVDLPLSIMFFVTVPTILVGWTLTLATATLSYVSDESESERRTIRISIVQALIFLGGSLGVLLGHYFVDEIGYMGAFILNIILYIIALIYIILRFEIKAPAKDSMKERCFCHDLGLVHDNFQKTLATPFKKRSNNFRLHILLLLLCIFLSNGAITGELHISKIHLTAAPFLWSIKTHAVFAPFLVFLTCIGLVIILPILKRIFGLEDTTLAIFGCASKIGCSLMISLADNTIMIYMSGIVGLMSLFPGVVSLSLLTQIVAPDEYGKILAVATTVFASAPLAFNEIYQHIYYSSLHIWKGFCFLGTAIIFILILVIFCLIHRDRKSNCIDTKKFQRLKIPLPDYDPDRVKC